MWLYLLKQTSEKQSIKSGVTDSDGKKSKVSQEKAASPVKKKEEFIVGKCWRTKTLTRLQICYLRKKDKLLHTGELFSYCENLSVMLNVLQIILNKFKGNILIWNIFVYKEYKMCSFCYHEKNALYQWGNLYAITCSS